MRSRTGYVRVFVTLALVVAAILLSTVAGAHYTKTVTLNPKSGPVGATVVVSGTGFTPGSPGSIEIHWDTETGPLLGTTAASANGTFSKQVKIPTASAGGHYIIACYVQNVQCSHSDEFHEMGRALFTVTVVTPSPSPSPSPTTGPTPKASPSPTPRAPIPPPPVGPRPILPGPPVPGDRCPLENPATAVQFDFEEAPAGRAYRGEHRGIEFAGDGELRVWNPIVAAHSGSKALLNHPGDNEFGSAAIPMRFRSASGFYDQVRVFVGLDPPTETEHPITAVMSAFTLADDKGRVVRRELGSDSVTFAPVAQDIAHCLFLEFPGQIYEVNIEYFSPESGGVFEAELIDDLMFGSAGTPPPLPADDIAPAVVIETPGDGSVERDWGGVRVRGNITEERGLRSAFISWTGVGLQRIGYFRLEGSRYGFGYGIAGRLLEKGNEYQVTIQATDLEGNTGRATARFRWNPPSRLDLIPETYEITQAVQVMYSTVLDFFSSNSVPMYEERPTLVRFYVRSNGEAPAENVGGQICLAGSCVSSLNRTTIGESVDPVTDFRDDLDETINFMLPRSWTEEGEREFLLRVNPSGRHIEECPDCLENNELAFRANFRGAKTLDVVMVRIRTRTATASSSDVGPTVRTIQSMWPSRIDLWHLEGDPALSARYDYTTKRGGGCGNAWNDLLDDLWWENFWTDDPVSWLRYFGMVKDVTPHSYSGCGFRPGDESAGVVDTPSVDRAGQIMAQEIGHNHGRRHAPGCGAARPDGSFPGTVVEDELRGTINDWGIDLRDMTLKDPRSTYDFMGYCGPKWVGSYSYGRIESAIDRVAMVPLAPSDIKRRGDPYMVAEAAGADVAHAAADPRPEVLVGSLDLFDGGAKLRRGFFRLPLPADREIPALDAGSYNLDLVSLEGLLLASYRFGSRETGDGIIEVGPAQVVVPWVAGTGNVVVSRDGKELLRVPVSANPPTVRITEPKPGAEWPASGRRQISWEASDPDGDKLTYAIQYSARDGESWRSIASGVSATSISVETAELAGGSARIRVWASDGVNTAFDEIDNPISVPGKEPKIFISAPRDGQRYETGRAAVLQGFATDLEDQFVEDSAYVWSSDREGELGRGPEQWALPLRDGKHRITLTVRDRDGNSASESVKIVIGERELPVAFIAGGGFLLVLGVGGFLLIRRRRSRSTPGASGT